MGLTPLLVDGRRLCACGRVASFSLIVGIGLAGKPWRYTLCACCASLETGVPVADLITGYHHSNALAGPFTEPAR